MPLAASRGAGHRPHVVHIAVGPALSEYAPVMGGVRWRPVIAVLAVIALLAIVLPFIAEHFDDVQPVAADTALPIGPGVQAFIAVPTEGWVMSKAASDPDRGYELAREGVGLSVRFVPLLSAKTPQELWAGYQKVITVSGGTLGPPVPTQTASGFPGLTGPLTGDGNVGSASAFLSPDHLEAVEFRVIGPPDATTDQIEAAGQVVASLTFRRDA
jgi:hypothetical protein